MGITFLVQGILEESMVVNHVLSCTLMLLVLIVAVVCLFCFRCKAMC